MGPVIVFCMDRVRKDLIQLIRDKQILITVGAGGVGKTTTAAVLGILAARLRQRTLVMTIDPARRLAASLGLDSLDNTPKAVPTDKAREAGIPAGHLHAMMLDQKNTFDDVIRRHSPDTDTYRRVLANKLYGELSSRLAGGQEYAAMEKLHELEAAGTYDLIILDTPPAANAIDFLDAPKKMVGLMDSAAVRVFVRSYEAAGRFSFKLLNLSAALIFGRIIKFIGSGFLDEIVRFFGDLNALLPGFRSRAKDVHTLLQSKQVAFFVVTSPDERATNEAADLVARLREKEMAPDAIVFNRVHIAASVCDRKQLINQLARYEFAEAERETLADRLEGAASRMRAMALANRHEIDTLREHIDADSLWLTLPYLAEDVYTMETLAKLSGYLESPPGTAVIRSGVH